MTQSYSVKKAAEQLGVHPRTIKNWIYSGKLQTFKTPNDYHRIPLSEIEKIKGNNRPKTAVLYARVSSHQQKDDLLRQIARLETYAKQNGYEIINIKDIASGLNDKRSGLYKALDLIRDQKVTTIIVENKDRLTRFGFRYLEYVIKTMNGNIIVINNIDKDVDLVKDLVDIITCFCAKIYGRRSNKAKARKMVEAMND
jgi:putative resolvase